MTFFQFLFTLLTVVGLCAGQVLFKLTASQMPAWDRLRLVDLLNPHLISALAVYAVATVLWLGVLRSVPLRLAYPFVALAFVLVPIASHYLLGERLGPGVFVGALLIVSGVAVSVWWS